MVAPYAKWMLAVAVLLHCTLASPAEPLYRYSGCTCVVTSTTTVHVSSDTTTTITRPTSTVPEAIATSYETTFTFTTYSTTKIRTITHSSPTLYVDGYGTKTIYVTQCSTPRPSARDPPSPAVALADAAQCTCGRKRVVYITKAITDTHVHTQLTYLTTSTKRYTSSYYDSVVDVPGGATTETFYYHIGGTTVTDSIYSHVATKTLATAPTPAFFKLKIADEQHGTLEGRYLQQRPGSAGLRPCLAPVKSYEDGATFRLYNKTTLRIARDTPDTCKSIPYPRDPGDYNYGFFSVSCRPDNVDDRGFHLDACTIDCSGNLQCGVEGFHSDPFLWLFGVPAVGQAGNVYRDCLTMYDREFTENPDPYRYQLVVVPSHS